MIATDAVRDEEFVAVHDVCRSARRRSRELLALDAPLREAQIDRAAVSRPSRREASAMFQPERLQDSSVAVRFVIRSGSPRMESASTVGSCGCDAATTAWPG